MQKSKIKKTLLFMLPSTVISVITPLASARCGSTKYSFLNDIKFYLINPSITTNKEIVDEFKKNKESIKKYVEISNPNKYDIDIRNVKPDGNDAILIDFVISRNGKKVWDKPDRPYKIKGLKDLSKSWNKKELAELSKILLSKIGNDPKNLVDMKNTNISGQFPSDINSSMIKLKSYDFISKKSADIDLIARIDSNLVDDSNGILPVNISLVYKNARDKIEHKIADKNLIFNTSDGLLSLNNLIKVLKVDDLILPKNIGEILPSKYNGNFDLNDSFKQKYPNVKLIKTSKSSRENDDLNGIKNMSFKFEYKNKQSSETADLNIRNQFYSTNKFQELVDSITIDDFNIQIDPLLLPSKYETNKINLKNKANLLGKNPNLKIEKSVLADDANGDLTVDLLIQDTVNELSAKKTFRYTGFYNIDKYNELVNSMTISDLDVQIDPLLLPSKYETSKINLKNKANLLGKNPNLKIEKSVSADDVSGVLTVDLLIQDTVNKLSTKKTFRYTGFYSINKYKELVNSMTMSDLDVQIDPFLLPTNYNPSNIQIKSDSPLIVQNPNLKIANFKKLTADDNNGSMNINITLIDEISNIEYSKTVELSGFYSIGKFEKTADSLTIDDLNVKVSQSVLPSNFDISKVDFKEGSQLLAKNPNLEIKSVTKSLVEDETGNLTINVTIVDKKNHSLIYIKSIKMTGFAEIKWTVSQLDEFVDKIVSTPIEEGKYLSINGHAIYRQLPLMIPQKVEDVWRHKISFNKDNSNIPQFAPSIVSDREPSDKKVHCKKVKVWWNIAGFMKTTYAQKVSVKLKYDNGGNIVYSSKSITLYFIAAPRLCDIDFKAEEV